MKSAPVAFGDALSRLTTSRLVQNVGALAIVQGMALLTPLITLPYLTRVLGPEEWGRMAWMQVILGYFSAFTDWGFALGGVGKVAALRNDRRALSKMFLAGWAAQAGLCLIALAVLEALSLWAPFFAQFKVYSLAAAAAIVSSVVFPTWLLVGLERMREVAMVQLSIRASVVPLIFLFVRTPDDGPYVIGLTAVAGLIGGAVAAIWMRYNVALDWRLPRMREVLHEFLDAGPIFFSRLWVLVYTSLTPTLLGTFAGAAEVGHYALADKLRTAAQSLLTPLSWALFPRMSYLFTHDRPAAIRLLWRSGRFVTLISGLSTVALFVFAGIVIPIVGGQRFVKSISVLQWLAPLPLITAASNVLGMQVMLPNRMMRAYNLILAATGLLSLSTIVPLIVWRGANGAAINSLLAESFVTVAMAGYVWRSRRTVRSL